VHLHQLYVFEVAPHCRVGKNLAFHTQAYHAPVRPYVDEGEAMPRGSLRQRLPIGRNVPDHVRRSGTPWPRQQSDRRGEAAQQKRTPCQDYAATTGYGEVTIVNFPLHVRIPAEKETENTLP